MDAFFLGIIGSSGCCCSCNNKTVIVQPIYRAQICDKPHWVIDLTKQDSFWIMPGPLIKNYGWCNVPNLTFLPAFQSNIDFLLPKFVVSLTLAKKMIRKEANGYEAKDNRVSC